MLAELLESFIQPLNNSVIYVKESDMGLTNDAWCFAVDIDLTM
jgi:hypothetical protein